VTPAPLRLPRRGLERGRDLLVVAARRQRPVPQRAVRAVPASERLRERGVDLLPASERRRFVYRRSHQRMPEREHGAADLDHPDVLGGVERVRRERELPGGAVDDA